MIAQNWKVKLGYLVIGYSMIYVTSILALLAIGLPVKLTKLYPQIYVGLLVMFIVAPLIEEYWKKYAVRKGFRQFPLLFGVVEMVCYLPNLAIISPLSFVIVRIPVLFMHWITGKMHERFQTRAGFYGAVLVHGLYNSVVGYWLFHIILKIG